jgi:hypothetical protein
VSRDLSLDHHTAEAQEMTTLGQQIRQLEARLAKRLTRREDAILIASQGKGRRQLLPYALSMDEWNIRPQCEDAPATYKECLQKPKWCKKVSKEKCRVLARLKKLGYTPQKTASKNRA